MTCGNRTCNKPAAPNRRQCSACINAKAEYMRRRRAFGVRCSKTTCARPATDGRRLCVQCGTASRLARRIALARMGKPVRRPRVGVPKTCRECNGAGHRQLNMTLAQAAKAELVCRPCEGTGIAQLQQQDHSAQRERAADARREGRAA